MATAAELVMAPRAARPETAGARKDAPDAAGGSSFAEVLDAEVQTTTEAEAASDTNAAASQVITAPQVQPATSPAAASAVELLISLQSADTMVPQPAVDTTETLPMTLSATPVAAPIVTPEIVTVQPAPAAPQPTSAQHTEQQAGQTGVLVQTPVEPETAPQGAAATVAVAAAAAIVPKGAQDEPAAETDAAAPADESSANTNAVAATPDPAAAIPTIKNPAAPITTAPAQAAIVAAAAPAPKPVTPNTPQPEEKAAPKVQPAASGETPAEETQPSSPKSDAQAANATSASPTTSNAAKPQTGVQALAADATPDVKADAPAPASPNTSTSFADLLAARGAPAETGKAATHPAMQSAPQAAVQVYTRFVERFDGRAQRFEVRLDPAELGRVDVRIEIGADRKVHAVLAAHDSAALTDLMRGQRALERALTDAGIDLKDGGLKFELANDSNRGLAGQEQRRDAWSAEEANVWRGFSTVDVPVEASADVTIAANAYPWRATRLDLVA